MGTFVDFADLASELLSGILDNCTDLGSLLALASTCRRLRHLYQLRKIHYLAQAIDFQYGPLDDAIQLVTHNDSQAPHIPRSVPWSVPLIKQVVGVGRVAAHWEDLYPSKHWHESFEDRRLLTLFERFKLRRALYRLWLYNRAFHGPKYSRFFRMTPLNLQTRSALLRNWSNCQLAEIADVQALCRQVLKSNVCPSNRTIERKFHKRFPDSKHQLLFNSHFNYPFLPRSQSQDMVESRRCNGGLKHYYKYTPTTLHEPGCEGWGDEVEHHFVVEDMLKLDPEQILWLKENAPSKSQVEAYRWKIGEWFFNNGTTFAQTLDFVLNERGVDRDELWQALERDELGIASSMDG